MARCGCSGGCVCAVQAGLTNSIATDVAGTGAASTPYVITADAVLVPDTEGPLTGDNPLKIDTQGLYVDGLVASRLFISTVVANTYQPDGADENTLVMLDDATGVAVTLPTNATAPVPIGAQIHFRQTGAGQVVFAAEAGATVVGTPGLKLRAQNSVGTAIKIATNAWLLSGDLAA